MIMIKLILAKIENPEYGQVEIPDINDRFALVKVIMETKFSIAEGIDYERAVQGDEFELAKIAYIILAHGSSYEVREINESFEKLEKPQCDIMDSFYWLIDQHKLKFPPKSIKLYEEFLCMPSSTRRSISKEFKNASPGSAHSSHTPRSASANVSYLLSPMQKACLFSPRDKSKKKMDDFEFFNEKKKLEKEIQNKDMSIYDLQYEIKEKEQQIGEYRQKYEDCKRKLTEMSGFKERAYEYESLSEKFSSIEKDKVYYEEKCKKYANELVILNSLQTANEQLENKVNYMKKDIEILEKKEKENLLELQRLRSCERELNGAFESKKQKEKEIIDLIDRNANLEAQLLSSNEKCKKLKSETDEMIDQLSGENALLLNEKSSLEAQLLNIRDMHKKNLLIYLISYLIILILIAYLINCKIDRILLYNF